MSDFIAIVWVECSVLSFLMAIDAFRREGGVSVGEAIVTAILSLFGPASLAGAFLIWLPEIPLLERELFAGKRQ